MSCQSIMITTPIIVRADAPVVTAIDLMFQHQVRTLPVVDALDIYQGLFGIQFLLKGLLPKAATLNQEHGLSDLAFMHDTLDDMRNTLKERLALLYPRAVGTVIHHDTSPLAPEDSILEAMLRVYHAGFSLPVVDKKSHKLVGIISHWSILAKLTERAS